MLDLTIDLFDEQSIQSAAAALIAYADGLSAKADEIVAELGKNAKHDAEMGWQSVTYDNEPIQAIVEQKPVMNGTEISVTGEQVPFVEFGAGVYYNGADSYPGIRPQGVAGIGQYGEGYGKRKAWGYRTITGQVIITHGVAANPIMYKALQSARQAAQETAKGVMK